MSEKLKVAIWSDVMCPFCYIGKREFEKALNAFPDKNQLDIEWKSYQLAPEIETDVNKSLNEYLSDMKGISTEDASRMNMRVTERGTEVGLQFNFDKAIPANTRKAHNLLHFAKEAGKQNEAEELLFRAYFTDGKNVDDGQTLLAIGGELGLDSEALKNVLELGTFDQAIQEDIYESFQLGVRGVPFFVFDNKYGVSGAQPSEVFTQTIEQAYGEWKQSQGNSLAIIEGESCRADGNCN